LKTLTTDEQNFARLAAIAADAPIVPEPYDEREEPFRLQFEKVIERQTGPGRSSNAAELHQDWVDAYAKMGWVYGPVRDTDKKTHPDMVPYDELGHLEKDKDAVFVALCEIARKWVHHPDESCDDRQELEMEVDSTIKAAAAALGAASERGIGWRKWKLSGYPRVVLSVQKSAGSRFYWEMGLRTGYMMSVQREHFEPDREFARLLLTGLLMPRAVKELREWLDHRSSTTSNAGCEAAHLVRVLDKMTDLGLGGGDD
jgi:hypothetical protein